MENWESGTREPWDPGPRNTGTMGPGNPGIGTQEPGNRNPEPQIGHLVFFDIKFYGNESQSEPQRQVSFKPELMSAGIH